MPPAAPEPPSEESLRAEAAEWFGRMRGPDAERYRPEFEQWLAAHPSHRPTYDRMAMRFEQARLVGHTPSGQARAGLPEAPARRPAARRYAALAASIVAIAASGALLLTRPHDPAGGPQPKAVAHAMVASPVGSIRRVRLDDGSFVTLDTDTRIETAFTPGERRLRLLQGRARFEVAHDAVRPFIVAAGDGEVVATGTVFDVSLVGDRPRVRLIQGSVEVRRHVAGATVPPELIARLTPGQTVPLGVPNATPSPAPADDRWISAMLTFDGTPLGEAIAEANRYSTRAIRLADPALGSLRVTGGFKAGDQEAIADGLAAGFGLRVERASNGDLILHRAT